jgi:hypothetical protein
MWYRNGKCGCNQRPHGEHRLQTGRKVYWDSTTGAFKNDLEANALIKAHYNNGWQLPKV